MAETAALRLEPARREVGPSDLPPRDRISGRGESLRVLMLTHNYPRYPGDRSGVFIARLAEGIVEGGVRVRILAPHAPGIPEFEDCGPISVRRFSYAPETLETLAYAGDLHRRAFRSPVAAGTVPLFLGSFYQALQQEIRTFRPDLIHAHWWLPAGLIARHCGLPYIITSHGTDVRLLDRQVLRLLASHVFSRARIVTAVSGYFARDIERMFPGLHRPVAITRMPVDIDLFFTGKNDARRDPARVLFAGNLIPRKGVDILLRALRLLRDRGVQCSLRVVGGGSEEARLKALSDELGLSPHVEWAGIIAQNRMVEEYGVASVTVLPSWGDTEGLGLVLAEALLAGSAVIGTRGGGIPEIVQDGVTGLLSGDRDAASIAEKLEALLKNESLRKSTVQRGRALAIRNHSVPVCARTFIELYRRATEEFCRTTS